MKIVVEVPESDLHKAVRDQVDAAVAKISEDYIKARVEQIITTKFERVTDKDVNQAMHAAASRLVAKWRQDCSRYNDDAVTRLVREAAAEAVRDALKKS